MNLEKRAHLCLHVLIARNTSGPSIYRVRHIQAEAINLQLKRIPNQVSVHRVAVSGWNNEVETIKGLPRPLLSDVPTALVQITTSQRVTVRST
jgi:hypothetical protein